MLFHNNNNDNKKKKKKIIIIIIIIIIINVFGAFHIVSMLLYFKNLKKKRQL